MDANLVLGNIFLLILLGMLVNWLFKKLTIRFFPKYAANRRLKAQARSDRRLQKYQKRQADEKAHLLSWAKGHPDDSTAKALLAEETASSTSQAAAPSEDGKPDPLVELRRRQQAADDYERRREARKVAEELESRRVLEWAIANPATPEGRRHLEETLDETNMRVMTADSEIYFAGLTVRDNSSESVEAIAAATRISEAEARKATDEGLISNIQAALAKVLSDSEQ